MTQSLSPFQFKSLQMLLEHEAGLYFGDHNRFLLEKRLDRFITHNNLSYEEILHALNSDREVLVNLIEELTVNETYFFREPGHYSLISDFFIPQLKHMDRKEIRILSMASSTGEEAYSVKIQLLESVSDCDSIYIDCLDISQKVTEKAKEGHFKGRSLKRMNPVLKGKYFDSEDKNIFTVKPELKRNMSFTSLNLFNLKNSERKYDIILCRNLLIYFRREKKLEALEILASILDDNGFLVIGTTETLYTIIGAFKLSKWNDISYYKKTVGQ